MCRIAATQGEKEWVMRVNFLSFANLRSRNKKQGTLARMLPIFVMLVGVGLCTGGIVAMIQGKGKIPGQRSEWPNKKALSIIHQPPFLLEGGESNWHHSPSLPRIRIGPAWKWWIATIP